MILIGLGSNLTTEQYTTSSDVINAALSALENENIQIDLCSDFYETEPVPVSDQPWYINAVAKIKTDLGAKELLNRLHTIEEKIGRVRRDRWEARIIDIDLLCYGDLVLPNKANWHSLASDANKKQMIVPHSRMHERNFVLIPLLEIAPLWVHPVFNKNTRQLLNESKTVGLVRKIT